MLHVEDLASDPMVHRFGDLFNPPGLTNFWGCVQADLDITGIRSTNFPPFACSDTRTALMYLNNRYFQASGAPITFRWFPDRIERTTEHNGLFLQTITIVPFERRAVLIQIDVKNIGGVSRQVDFRFGIQGGVTQTNTPWNAPLPPSENDNFVDIDNFRKALTFSAQQSSAFSIQGLYPNADDATHNSLKITLSLEPGESKQFYYINCIGEKIEDVQNDYDKLSKNTQQIIIQTRKEWNEELNAAITPNNDRFSGHMPILETTDSDISKLYYMGILGVIYFKRDNPYSRYGRAYDTLMPRYWQTVTFLWDYHLSAAVHALLDPNVMRKYLEIWMLLDTHKHFGTEYLTGGSAGYWYSVNDYAMTRMIFDYLRWNGNRHWLDKKIGNESIHVYLDRYVKNWKKFKSKSGLADYGDINNLLECVSTYIHEVASLNAANVFNMRTAADIFELRNERNRAKKLREEAGLLVTKLQNLYVNGKGFWHTRFPNANLVEVRHCYDFFTIVNTIGDDLTAKQKSEMVSFFQNELQTPTWMYALSAFDENAMFNVRPDHQWTGAYPAWPPQAAIALYRLGEIDLAFSWLKGLARSANQGPFGQAHFVEHVIEPECGGAKKAPPDIPYITDWACSSNGSWTQVIIESIFGVSATLNKGISAQPQFGQFDPKSELKNLRFQDKLYHITRSGLKVAE
jgi:hypothetical protein